MDICGLGFHLANYTIDFRISLRNRLQGGFLSWLEMTVLLEKVESITKVIWTLQTGTPYQHFSEENNSVSKIAIKEYTVVTI